MSHPAGLDPTTRVLMAFGFIFAVGSLVLPPLAIVALPLGTILVAKGRNEGIGVLGLAVVLALASWVANESPLGWLAPAPTDCSAFSEGLSRDLCETGAYD